MDSSSTALWYISRATGVVCLLLFTAVILLGLVVSRQGRLPGLPRFGVVHLHRYLSLLAVSFITVHVLSAVADTFVNISLASAIIPFVAKYQPFWLGLGAVALDLMIAVIVTSLIRSRIGRRTWRVVHWLAYACWPIAIIHSIGAGPDVRSGPLLWLTIAATAAVAIAIAVRTTAALRTTSSAAQIRQLLAGHGPTTREATSR
ncbi:MAG TPA: ferric reductase-like transmembrane domain-containing protein [Streptosporangiaceae bacterium]|nr:ferric reductase-like transmembrane domain-containing protein [Streptosporangiaceae bacterium]